MLGIGRWLCIITAVDERTIHCLNHIEWQLNITVISVHVIITTDIYSHYNTIIIQCTVCQTWVLATSTLHWINALNNINEWVFLIFTRLGVFSFYSPGSIFHFTHQGIFFISLTREYFLFSLTREYFLFSLTREYHSCGWGLRPGRPASEKLRSTKQNTIYKGTFVFWKILENLEGA